MRQDAKCSSTTTTTVQITKVRGLSLDILALLESKGGLYTPEIAYEVGKPKASIRKYMHRLYQYGCVDRFSRWGWEITASGSDVLLYNNNNIDDRNETLTRQKRDTNVTETSHDSHTTRTSRQLDLSLFEKDTDFSDPERVVVLALAEHYERTGVKYQFYCDKYDFCTQMGISSLDVGEVMAKLTQEGIIYVWNEKRYSGITLRVGLKKIL